jgi:hypothetical protein
MAAGQQNAAAVDLARLGIGSVEIWARLGDDLTAAGWAGCPIRLLGDLGMTLLAELAHSEKTTLPPAR